MREVRLVPHGWPCTLAECPPGPFVAVDRPDALGFKTEYGRSQLAPECDPAQPGDRLRFVVSRLPDAYCLGSGEAWCADVLVQPLVVEVTDAG